MLTSLDKPDQVKDVAIKIKSLQQKIRPINIGAGATRPYIYVIFDKEAAAQFTPKTIVYLSWKHTDGKEVKGYNAFIQVSEKPNVWKIMVPPTMLHEGTVLARIELVDNVSIAVSTTFEINILYNPNENESFTASDDYGVFQEAIIQLTEKVNQTTSMLEDTQSTVKDLQELFNQVQEFYLIIKKEQKKNKKIIKTTLDTSYHALATAMEALNRLTWGKI